MKLNIKKNIITLVLFGFLFNIDKSFNIYETFLSKKAETKPRVYTYATETKPVSKNIVKTFK